MADVSKCTCAGTFGLLALWQIASPSLAWSREPLLLAYKLPACPLACHDKDLLPLLILRCAGHEQQVL